MPVRFPCSVTKRGSLWASPGWVSRAECEVAAYRAGVKGTGQASCFISQCHSPDSLLEQGWAWEDIFVS